MQDLHLRVLLSEFLAQRAADTDSLTAEAQKFNAKLLDHVTEDTDYPTIKSICEGRELPAYEAASEFTAKIGAQLDDLLSELGGEDGTLKTLEKLQAARNQAQQKLTELLEQMRDSVQNSMLEQAVIDAANQAESKTQQAEAVAKMVDTTARQNKAAIRSIIASEMGLRSSELGLMRSYHSSVLYWVQKMVAPWSLRISTISSRL